MDGRCESFEDFWPLYVKQHQSKLNRTLHCIGASLALACVAAALVKRRPWLLIFAPVAGYGFAWAGHFFVEKNTPSSFSYPGYSAVANFVMYWKTITGTMDAEVERILMAEQERSKAPPVSAQTVN
jgi:hypothetical protein